MDNKLKKQIDELDNRRSQILRVICEDEKVYHPEVLLMLIREIRSITKILKVLQD